MPLGLAHDLQGVLPLAAISHTMHAFLGPRWTCDDADVATSAGSTAALAAVRSVYEGFSRPQLVGL